MNSCFTCGITAKESDKIDKLLRCSRCKAAFYCSALCQRSDWKRHKKTCRSPPNKSTCEGYLDGTILLSADAPKMIDLGADGPAQLPLRAFHQLDDLGGSSLILMFSNHAGEDALKPYVKAYFGEVDNEMGWNAEALVNIPWGVVTSAMSDFDEQRRLLGPSEAIFNETKFPAEIKELLDAGIITDTGKRYKMGYYDPHPICCIHLPLLDAQE